VVGKKKCQGEGSPWGELPGISRRGVQRSAHVKESLNKETVAEKTQREKLD